LAVDNSAKKRSLNFLDKTYVPKSFGASPGTSYIATQGRALKVQTNKTVIEQNSLQEDDDSGDCLTERHSRWCNGQRKISFTCQESNHESSVV
jgi:hypothetical protein